MLAPETAPPPFPTHARSVVRSVRGSFSDLLVAMGADPQDPGSISREAGLTKTLAWKIAKVVQADDPAVALQHMPGASGVKLLLRGAQRAGVPADQIRTAREAVEGFESLIRVHCGDRATLEMMGVELSPAGREQRDEHHRKLLYQGASYLWGVQARVTLKVGIVAPGAEPGLLDFASINGLIDFRRLRPDVSWVMASRQSQNDDGTPMATSASEAIDPRYAGPEHAPLLADFCSDSALNLRRRDRGSYTSFELVEGPVGNTGALTCVFGAVQRGIPYWATKENDRGEHRARCDIPAELMLLDFFVHESMTWALPPEVALESDIGAGGPDPRRTRLPMAERLQDLGAGPLAPATPEAPDYRGMLAAVYGRLGWDPGAFHGFRLRIAYPAFPTAYVLHYLLPETPGG